MKTVLLSFILTVSILVSDGQVKNPLYDKSLADSLGGDAYGMKKYILVILKTGTVHIENKEKEDSFFNGHMANIIRLASNGKLIVSGPMKKNSRSYEGIFILNAKSFDEAKILLAQDPAISYHLLDTEMYEWYGSAALPEYLPYHEKITR